MRTSFKRDGLTAAKLHPQARGRWLDIFRNLCPGMFDDAISRLGTHVTCPLHGGAEDFRFIKKARGGKENTEQCGAAMCSCGVYPDGFALLHKVMGGPFIEVLKEVDGYLNGYANQERKPIPVPAAPTPKVDDGARARRDLMITRKMWESGDAFNMDRFPYYENRGLDRRVLSELRNVRTVDSLRYSVLAKNPETGKDRYERVGDFPAIFARMQSPEGETVAVHRTWLSEDRKGKAPVNKPKKLSVTPGCAGAAIRLFDADRSDVLGLAEGIETAISARQLSAGGYWPNLGAVPTWACFAERNIRNFVIPKHMLKTLRTIVVFADNDLRGVGVEAATALKERFAVEHPEIEVIIVTPPTEGYDWNDVLVNL